LFVKYILRIYLNKYTLIGTYLYLYKVAMKLYDDYLVTDYNNLNYIKHFVHMKQDLCLVSKKVMYLRVILI